MSNYTKNKTVDLGEISDETLKRLKLNNYPKRLIIFNIKKIVKHIVDEGHYKNISEDEVENKIKEILKNASYVAFDKSQDSLQFIKTEGVPELVAFRFKPELTAGYVKSLYPTTYDKILVYYSKPYIDIIKI